MTLSIVLFSCVLANEIESEGESNRKLSCGAVTLAHLSCKKGNFRCMVKNAHSIHKHPFIAMHFTKTVNKSHQALARARTAGKAQKSSFNKKILLDLYSRFTKIFSGHPSLKNLNKKSTKIN